MIILVETFDGLMTKMSVWKNDLESKGLKVNMGKPKLWSQLEISIHCKVLVDILVSYAEKVSGLTQSSVADVRFGFTKNVLISQVH